MTEVEMVALIFGLIAFFSGGFLYRKIKMSEMVRQRALKENEHQPTQVTEISSDITSAITRVFVIGWSFMGAIFILVGAAQLATFIFQ